MQDPPPSHYEDSAIEFLAAVPAGKNPLNYPISCYSMISSLPSPKPKIIHDIKFYTPESFLCSTTLPNHFESCLIETLKCLTLTVTITLSGTEARMLRLIYLILRSFPLSTP